MKMREGEVEFRRDSLILSIVFLIISLACTKMIVARVDGAVAEQRAQRVDMTLMIKKAADTEARDEEVLKRLRALEANERALNDLQKENLRSIKEIKRKIKTAEASSSTDSTRPQPPRP